jgi:hypothetical protein
VAYTNRLKLQQMHELGLQGTPQDYHEDHLVSLDEAQAIFLAPDWTREYVRFFELE